MTKLFALTSVLLTTGSVVFATSVTTFGTLSEFTVGSGNPNNAFEITTINDGGNTVILGLQAQQRYFNPVLANNGAGTFYASPGANYGTPATPSTPGTPSIYSGATWNFDFYADATTLGYTYKIFLALNGSSLGLVDPLTLPDNGSSTHNGYQNSENIAFFGMDPNATGIYDLELVAYNAAGAQVGSSAIQVQVGTVPDATSTGMLLTLGFIGLAVFGVRQNRLQAAK